MKVHVTTMVVWFSTLAALSTFAAGQQRQAPQNSVVVEAGNDIRCRLEKGVRIKEVGEPITGRVVEPVYSGTTIAIPGGAAIKGHISSISNSVPGERKLRILRGDFSPVRTATVTFDEVVLPDGATIPIHTDATIGISGMQKAQYMPKSERPGIRAKLSDSLKPIREPNKLHRLEQAAMTSLPYHPEYLSQGTVFDATMLDSISTPLRSAETAEVRDTYLRLRLLTALSSQITQNGASVEAVVLQPYYKSEGIMAYPVGTKLTGTVEGATSSGWMRKGGSLLFSFNSAQTPDGTIIPVKATVIGIEGTASQELKVDEEGDVKATTSLFTRLRAPLSLIGPSRSAADSTLNKTAFSRAGEGFSGFGLSGSGAAQASPATATGFGYFGGVMGMYDAFFAKGSNVGLPANTRILAIVSEAQSGTVIH